MLHTTEINTLFRKAFNGHTNMLTPFVLRRGQAGKYLYELSTGEFMGSKMYGVTVLTLEGGRTDLSDAFESGAKAEDYIKSLEYTL